MIKLLCKTPNELKQEMIAEFEQKLKEFALNEITFGDCKRKAELDYVNSQIKLFNELKELITKQSKVKQEELEKYEKEYYFSVDMF